MVKIWPIAILLILSAKSSSFAEELWKVMWNDGPRQETKHQQEIPFDREYHFVIDKIPCHVSKGTLNKVNDEILESRSLWCSISNDTSVGVDLSYNVKNKNYHDARQLFINKKGIIYTPYIGVFVIEK